MLLWLVVAGLALVGFVLLRAAGFAVIQRHGAVMIKFLVIWLLGWLLISLLLVGVLGPVGNTPTWNSVGVAGGVIIAAVCFLTARRTA